MRNGFIKILTTALAGLIVTCGVAFAELQVDGTIKAELVSDPLRYNPNIPRKNPWQGDEQEGPLIPGYYVGHFSKMSLYLKYKNNQTEALLPVTLGVYPFSSSSGPAWQVLMLAEDYLNIPFFMSMKTRYLTYSSSSRPVGDKFGFMDFEDPLAIGKKLNSPQPMFTFKVEMDFPNNWEGAVYSIFDQKVEGLPIWERIPSGNDEVGNEIIDSESGARVFDYSFTDELAQYNLLRMMKQAGDSNRVSLWTKKCR